MFSQHDYDKAREILKKGPYSNELTFDSIKITSIPGPLPYNLRILNISNTHINKIPKLPDCVEVLICRQSFYLEEIRNLPTYLRILDCGQSVVRFIGDLPTYLDQLVCDNTNIQDLPLLPYGLRYLDCTDCNVGSINGELNNIETLKIGGTRIQKLPHLPPTLQYLDCSRTLISNIPNLPLYLSVLDINNTNIRTISGSLDYLKKLNCSDDFMLRNFDRLPLRLQDLSCMCFVNVNCICFSCFKVGKIGTKTLRSIYTDWLEHLSSMRIKERAQMLNSDLVSYFCLKNIKECMADDSEFLKVLK
jgi:Leucine-rich repeat (LRR) protein